MALVSGLAIGLIFGFLLKRSRMCFTGLVRDVYLERRVYNVAIFMAVVSIEGLIYHGLGHMGLVRIPQYLPPFSLLSIAVGSFVFGIGAVLAGGCMTSTLVKCGDGRATGLITLAGFLFSGYAVSAGFASELSRAIRSVAVVDDNLALRTTLAPVALWALVAVVVLVVMRRHRATHKPTFTMPASYTGIRHVLCEKVWAPETTAVLIGVLAGITFLVSGHFGRHFGFAIVSPVLSWAYLVLDPQFIVGACNPYDVRFGWGSMFVLGIVLGSLATTVAGREFSFVLPDRATAVKALAGGLFMGIGGVWGQGCLVANGLVGTAQLSMKSWYALLFLVLGIWLAARVFLARKHKR